MTRKTKTVQERFFPKVCKTDTCWVWTGSRDHKGYGRLMVGNKPRLAHRISYEIHIGPVQEGLFVCHSCDNPSCVNPEHLWLGSNKDNAYDMIAKGRWRKPPTKDGTANSNAKLTPEAVLEIRSIIGNTQALAKKYGVSITAIKRARNGHGWKTAPGSAKKNALITKLTPEAVSDIRTSGLPTDVLSKKYGVTASTIVRTRSRVTWKNHEH